MSNNNAAPKAIAFKDLPSHSLFRIFAERKGFYHNGEKRVGLVRSPDFRVYKKWGNSHSSTKGGDIAILGLTDLVVPYTPADKE